MAEYVENDRATIHRFLGDLDIAEHRLRHALADEDLKVARHALESLQDCLTVTAKVLKFDGA